MSKNTQFVQEYITRSIKFGVSVIHFCNELPKSTSAQVIAKQVLRSSTSVGANFVEAQATHSRQDFLNFLTIALKSANETIYWLKLLIEARIGNINREQALVRESQELANILGAILKKLRS